MKRSAIYRRLLSGENITVEEISANKVFVEANVKAMAVDPTYSIDTPQRIGLRQEIKEQLLAMGAVNVSKKSGKIEYTAAILNEKRADIIIGLPAAGKSTVLAEPLSIKYASRIIDSDMAKAMLPEYANGIGAFAVHFESGAIIDEVFKSSIEKGENIVIATIGSKAEKVISLAEKLQEKGYKTYLHLNEVPNEVSIRRAALRYMEQGRYIPINLLIEYQNKPSEVYEKIKNREVFYGYSKYDNNVPRGEKATCIENYERAPVQGMGDSGNFNGRYGDRLDHTETQSRGNSGVRNSSVKLIEIERLRVYQETENSITVKLVKSEKTQEKRIIFLDKKQVRLDNEGFVVAISNEQLEKTGMQIKGDKPFIKEKSK
jgi:shikimate kinase